MDQAKIVKEIEKARVRETIIRQLDGGDNHDCRMMRDQLADEVTIDFGGGFSIVATNTGFSRSTANGK